MVDEFSEEFDLSNFRRTPKVQLKKKILRSIVFFRVERSEVRLG